MIKNIIYVYKSQNTFHTELLPGLCSCPTGRVVHRVSSRRHAAFKTPITCGKAYGLLLSLPQIH